MRDFSRMRVTLLILILLLTIPLISFVSSTQKRIFQNKAQEPTPQITTPANSLKSYKDYDRKNFQPFNDINTNEYDRFLRTNPPVPRYKEKTTSDKPLSPQDSSLSDLDVAYISRTPHLDYDASKQWPDENEIVTFTAHVKNRGTIPTGDFSYVWKTDEGSQVVSTPGTSASLSPGEEREITINWRWQHKTINQSIQGSHIVALSVDPNNLITEVSESNNIVKDYTQALGIGFWVEQKVYDYFNQNQLEYCKDKLCSGSNSWDDWAQRQVNTFNSLLEKSKSTPFPNGAIDRVRLGRITIVPDCTLPNANHPADDKSFDLMWGFTSAKIAPVANCQRDADDGNKGLYFTYPHLQDLELPLIHELSHARYLIDLYGFSVAEDEVLVTEGGVPIADTPYLPLLALPPYPNRYVYYNKAADSMMGMWKQDLGYDPHSVGALNRVSGRRARGGNFSPPSVIGEYLYDLPATTTFQLVTKEGLPVANASIKIFRAKPRENYWYGKIFSGNPDIEANTDGQGMFIYQGNIFSQDNILAHTYGSANGIFLYRIQSGNQIVYGFQEITDLNLAYWAGNTQNATITIKTNVTYPPTPTPTSTPTPTPTICVLPSAPTWENTPVWNSNTNVIYLNWTNIPNTINYIVNFSNDKEAKTPFASTLSYVVPQGARGNPITVTVVAHTNCGIGQAPLRIILTPPPTPTRTPTQRPIKSPTPTRAPATPTPVASCYKRPDGTICTTSQCLVPTCAPGSKICPKKSCKTVLGICRNQSCAVTTSF